MKWAIVELAETLVFAGMVRGDVVGESKEKESEGFPRNEVEAGPLDVTGLRLELGCVATGLRGLFHLFESVYDRGVESVFVGEMVLKVAAGGERLWAEGTPVPSGKLAKETVEMELAECGGGVLTALTMKEGKVASVHLGAPNRGERLSLVQSLTRRGVGHMLVDEVRFEAIPIFE
jgi:hypothetical protein